MVNSMKTSFAQQSIFATSSPNRKPNVDTFFQVKLTRNWFSWFIDILSSGSQAFLHDDPQLMYTIFCRPRGRTDRIETLYVGNANI